MAVTVYTQQDCVGCRYTKKFLAQHSIAFTEVDVDRAGKRDELIAQGFKQMPVVVSSHGKWSGYRRERLMDLRDAMRSESHG